MKKLLILSGIIFPMFSFSQPLHFNLFGGFSNYQGDLQDKPFTISQANAEFGFGVEYSIDGHVSVRGGFNFAKVSGDDKKNTQADLVARNLNFKSNITEANLAVVYNIFDINEYRLTPYVFGGVAIYHFDPYTYDTSGNKYYLKPLGTEGQGLMAYPERKSYSLTQFAIPFGAGVKFRLTQNVMVGYEIGFRKLFTDYLDDLSTTYVDQTPLEAERGPKAVELAFRGGEVKPGAFYPIHGTVRGGEKFKDWYYFSGITLSIGINHRKRYYENSMGGKSRIDCPPSLK